MLICIIFTVRTHFNAHWILCGTLCASWEELEALQNTAQQNAQQSKLTSVDVLALSYKHFFWGVGSLLGSQIGT